MGKSQPPPADFDLVGSYARLRGDDVQVVLAQPADRISALTRAVFKRDSGPRVLGEAQHSAHDAPRLTLRVERARLTNGIWRISLQDDDSRRVPLEARLLVQGSRPLVLLWGSSGVDALEPGRQYPRFSRQWAASKVGHGLDRTLALLPEQRAKSVRKRIRRTARRVF